MKKSATLFAVLSVLAIGLFGESIIRSSAFASGDAFVVSGSVIASEQLADIQGGRLSEFSFDRTDPGDRDYWVDHDFHATMNGVPTNARERADFEFNQRTRSASAVGIAGIIIWGSSTGLEGAAAAAAAYVGAGLCAVSTAMSCRLTER